MARVKQTVRTRVKKSKGGGNLITCNVCKGTGKIKNWHKKK